MTHPGKALTHKFPPREAVQIKCEVCGKPAMENHVMCESCRQETYLIGIYHNANIMTRRFGPISYTGDTRFSRNYYKGKALVEKQTGRSDPMPEPDVKYSSGKTVCLYCGNPEQVRIRNDGSEYHFRPMKGREFICSQCVQMFFDHDREYLKKLLEIAKATDQKNQIKAIETFLPRKEKHGKRPSKSVERNFNRKRTNRIIRDKKRFSQPVEA